MYIWTNGKKKQKKHVPAGIQICCTISYLPTQADEEVAPEYLVVLPEPHGEHTSLLGLLWYVPFGQTEHDVESDMEPQGHGPKIKKDKLIEQKLFQ